MKEVLLVVGVIVVWLLLVRVVFPRLGIHG
jgi:hypothetical protein